MSTKELFSIEFDVDRAGFETPPHVLDSFVHRGFLSQGEDGRGKHECGSGPLLTSPGYHGLQRSQFGEPGEGLQGTSLSCPSATVVRMPVPDSSASVGSDRYSFV